MDEKTTVDRIRALNDAARRHSSGICRIFVTRGIADLPVADQQIIMSRVVAFDDFTEDNDPWGEHDFGSFEYDDQTIFWKIDYYDLLMRNASRDPADPAATQRVLTVMFAYEY